MKKSLLTVFFVCGLFLSLVVGLQSVELAWANWAVPPDDITISIQSPQNITYNVNKIPINFTVERNIWHHTSYVLDDAEQVVIECTNSSSILFQDPGGLSYKHATAQFSAVLSNLSDGRHNFTVREYYVYDWNPIHIAGSANVSFTIDTQSEFYENLSPSIPTTSETVNSSYFTQQPASPSPSSTQQPITEQTQTAGIDPRSSVSYDPGSFPLLQIILVIALSLAAIVSVLLYFTRRKQIS
jgi:hypothetical protein